MTILVRIDDLLHVGPISDDVRALYLWLVGSAPAPDEQTVSKALDEMFKLGGVSVEDALFVVAEAEFARRGAPGGISPSVTSSPEATETPVSTDSVAQEAQEKSSLFANSESPQVSDAAPVQVSDAELIAGVIARAEAAKNPGQLTESDLSKADLAAFEASHVAEATHVDPAQVVATTQENV